MNYFEDYADYATDNENDSHFEHICLSLTYLVDLEDIRIDET